MVSDCPYRYPILHGVTSSEKVFYASSHALVAIFTLRFECCQICLCQTYVTNLCEQNWKWYNSLIIVRHILASVANCAQIMMRVHRWRHCLHCFCSIASSVSSSTLLPFHFITLSTQHSLGRPLSHLIPIGRPSITAGQTPPLSHRLY